MPAWNIELCGLDATMSFFDNYWSRFQNPRRYYANEDIPVHGSRADAFMYWYVKQERDGELVLAWGAYDRSFRLEGQVWKIVKGVVHIRAMTTLERGWAMTDKIMAL